MLGVATHLKVLVDHAKMYRDTKAIFDELDIDVDPKEKSGQTFRFK